MPSEPGIAANPIEDNPVTELPVADSMTPNIILSETRQSEHSMPVDEKIFSPQPTVSESGFDTAPQASSEQVINDPGVTSTDARVSAHEVSAAEPLDQHRMTTVAVAIEVLDNKPFANITTSVTDDRDQGRPDTDDSEDVPLSIATNFSAADERKQQGYNPEASGSDRVIVRVTPPADFVDSSLMDLDPVDDSDRSAVHTLPRSTTATSMVSSSVVVLWCMAMLGFLLLVFWLWPAAPDQQQGVQRQALTPVVGDAGEQLPREHPALASSVPLSSSGPSQDMSESSSQSSPRNSSVGSADQGLQEVFRLEDKNLRIRVERDTVVNRPQDTRAIIQSPEIDATLFPVTPVISEISPAPVVESRQAVSERQPLQLSSSEHELAVDDSRLTADIDQVPAPGQTPRSTQATEPPPVAQPRMSIAINNTPSSLSSGSDFQADAGAGIAANLSLVKHTVVRGDTLWHIAIKYLDNPYLYPQLAHLSQIDNPDLIYPGDVVTIEFNANESP
jgi:nucleoid-associated protein YgaU